MMVGLLVAMLQAKAQEPLYVGGDISLLPTYEEHGANYMDKDGKSISDMLSFLKAQGMNAMRVRLFVEPDRASAADKGQGVRQDLDYVKALGKRIKEAGLKLMLDFHYSDTWADPAHQATPHQFMMVNTPATSYIYDYTKECLQAMVAAGATPDFIQTGNEISWGMMWDSGCKLTANAAWSGYTNEGWDNFATALKNAGRACREVCPEAWIIIHTEQAANTPLVTDFYQRIAANGVDYDIIGTSYYPYYHGNLTQLNKTLTQLESKFPDKKIMVVETGCAYHWKVGDNDQGYALSYEGQRKFTADLIATLLQHKQVNGLFWWFPEANEYGLDWNTKRVTDGWYNAGLFDNETGKALPALYELKNFTNGVSGMNPVTVDGQNAPWYSLQGQYIARPDRPGLYIHGTQKTFVR